MLVSWQCVVLPDQRVAPRGPSGDAASKWCVACSMPRSSSSRARDTPAFAWTRSCLWLRSTRPRSIDAGRAGQRWSLLSSTGCASLFARARCRTPEQLERDLVEAFTRRFTVGRKIEGRAWARLLDERYSPEVEAIIGDVVDERRGEWRAMVTRAIDRGEIPPGTDPQLLLHLVRAIVRRPPAGYELAGPRGADGHRRRSCWNA